MEAMFKLQVRGEAPFWPKEALREIPACTWETVGTGSEARGGLGAVRNGRVLLVLRAMLRGLHVPL